jgi:anti-sigma B factor antagonist
MELSFRQQNDTTIVSIAGSVDALTAGEATSYIMEQIRKSEANKSLPIQMVLDLSQVEFMSSAGLRAILASLKECRQKGGDLRLAAAQMGVDKILRMSGFTSILKSFPSIDEAVNSYRA